MTAKNLPQQLEKYRGDLTVMRLHLQSDGTVERSHAVEFMNRMEQCAADLEASIALNRELVGAAKSLHDDTAEYQRINSLGGYDNHSMKRVREAITLAEQHSITGEDK